MNPLERAIARELRRFAQAILESQPQSKTTRYVSRELAEAARLSERQKK